MITGTKRAAALSECGGYRWTLTRTWDERPILLVAMFNPSAADALKDDPTITLVCHIAAHNGFGGIVVVNAIPLRSAIPGPAVDMIRGKGWNLQARSMLQQNMIAIRTEVQNAGAVMLAWGALGVRVKDWMSAVEAEIVGALPAGVPLYCLRRTAAGHPMHPLARGKYKVAKTAALVPWSR